MAEGRKNQTHLNLPSISRQGLPKMWTLLLGVTLGLLASCRSEQLQVNSRSCSYAGVFLVEGEARHFLTFDNALKVCEQEQSVMATHDQVRQAFDQKMETCRHGWISNMSTAILRHTHHENCAMNSTGFILHPRQDLNESFDAYCFDETVGPEMNCDKAFDRSPEKPSPEPGLQVSTAEELKPFDGVTEMTSPGTGITLEPEAATTSPAVEDSSLQWEHNVSVFFTQTPWDVDQPTGSGMLPTLSEGETMTTSPPGGETNQTQLPVDNKQGDAKVDPPQQPPNGKKRMNDVPQTDHREGNESGNWLVILCVIVAVAAIFFVCVAVAKRKSWCGKKQTLTITSKESEGNGAAGVVASNSQAQEREQEMVTLMSKEKIQENGNTEEFTAITLEETADKEV
ncbi:CD44 antigen-like [Nerophis ophidion]|uniref:CD44 antigen-like n=1 Tax=Nerophis ophidion TaxID=159077 RepID=UPI002ADFC8FC|nr:CD44 antigen-like [Nerophis ophidion]